MKPDLSSVVLTFLIGLFCQAPIINMCVWVHVFVWLSVSVCFPAFMYCCTVRNCYRLDLQISWQHVNNQIDVMSFRETSSCCFSLFSPFCAFLSWFNVVSHLMDFISRSDVTPFHSVKQYVSTGFELTAFRLCKASYFWSKGTYIICTRCTALSCCSDELLVTVRSTAPRQSTFTD